jgi:hypothetical protein
MTDVLLAILVLAVMFGIMLLITRWRLQGASKDVISIFRKNGAISTDTSMSLERLGLQPKSLAQRLFGMRDYRPSAMQTLVHAGIIVKKENDTYYLCEDKMKPGGEKQ